MDANRWEQFPQDADVGVRGVGASIAFGRAWGEPIGVARHRPAVEVKGATDTEPSVRCEPDGTRVAQCVIDV